MFKRQSLVANDEIYTMGINSWSRDNVRVLTSIGYSKMSAADKALEDNPRTDHDYGISWIRREGQGHPRAPAGRHAVRHRRPRGRRLTQQAIEIQALDSP